MLRKKLEKSEKNFLTKNKCGDRIEKVFKKRM